MKWKVIWLFIYRSAIYKTFVHYPGQLTLMPINLKFKGLSYRVVCSNHEVINQLRPPLLPVQYTYFCYIMVIGVDLHVFLREIQPGMSFYPNGI
jgi:hypothetical protein